MVLDEAITEKNIKESKMKDHLYRNSLIFLDELPKAPKSADNDDLETELGALKWRCQQVLARHPWGCPALVFIECYKKWFERDMNQDMEEVGFSDLPQMIDSLKDIFTVQNPDEVTSLIFPRHSDEQILHDARLGHQFLDQTEDEFSPSSLATTVSSFDSLGGNIKHSTNELDFDLIMSLAIFNRDQDFPEDVVLAGEQYREFILPSTEGNIEGTRGIHQVVLIGAANPGHCYIHVRDGSAKKILRELKEYYEPLERPSDTHLVPDEFIYNGFPCVVHNNEDNSWERCSIIGRSSSSSNRVLVELVDFGGMKTINRTDLYLMPKKLIEFQRQAVCVSMAGLKPKDKHRFSTSASMRLLCFSHQNYVLDCLLLDVPEEPIDREDQALNLENSDSYEPSSNVYSSDFDTPATATTNKSKRAKNRVRRQRAQFVAIFCDRNDDKMDIFLDKVLVLETYCDKDVAREQEIESLRAKFEQELLNIKRPINPLADKNQ